MTERGAEQLPYWNDDILAGEVALPDGAALVRLRLHQHEEPIPNRATLVPLTQPAGSRVYVHTQPYILAPDIALTVDLRLGSRAAHVIGEVMESTWAGMRHVAIGQAQAWHYPADRLLVLWECYLRDPQRQADPLDDLALAILWRGFEDQLLTRFPTSERIATPAWEDLYDRPAWRAFLIQQGYVPETAAVFSKRASGHPD